VSLEKQCGSFLGQNGFGHLELVCLLHNSSAQLRAMKLQISRSHRLAAAITISAAFFFTEIAGMYSHFPMKGESRIPRISLNLQ
jgi:hypothetical protein